MARESAERFVKSFYENDEFMKDMYRRGAFTGGKANDPQAAAEQSRKMTEVSRELGYDFTVEEFDAANSAYIKSLGAWKGIKMIFHMMRVVKSAEREAKKQKKG